MEQESDLVKELGVAAAGLAHVFACLGSLEVLLCLHHIPRGIRQEDLKQCWRIT